MVRFQNLAPAGLRLAVLLFIAAAVEAPGPRAGEAVDPPSPEGKPAAAPEGAGGEVELAPRAEGKSRPLQLQAGELHLLVILQALADASGVKVVLGRGDELKGQTIRVSREIEADQKSIAGALTEAGFAVNEELYRGKKVLWVTRELKPTSKRGSILPPGERVDPAPAPAGTPLREARVRVFQEGEKGAASYLVILETRSKVEAEDAASVLRAYLQGRAAKKAAPGSGNSREK